MVVVAAARCDRSARGDENDRAGDADYRQPLVLNAARRLLHIRPRRLHRPRPRELMQGMTRAVRDHVVVGKLVGTHGATALVVGTVVPDVSGG